MLHLISYSIENQIPFPVCLFFGKKKSMKSMTTINRFTHINISTVNSRDQKSTCFPFLLHCRNRYHIWTVKHLHTPKCWKIIVITALYSFSLLMVPVYGTGVDSSLKAIHINTHWFLHYPSFLIRHLFFNVNLLL